MNVQSPFEGTKVQGPLQKSRYIFSFSRWSKGQEELKGAFLRGCARHEPHGISRIPSMLGVSVYPCVCAWHCPVYRRHLAKPFQRVQASPGSLALEMGITALEEGGCQGRKCRPLSKTLQEKTMFRAEWCQAHHSSLPSYQHSQNTDRHNTDNFPVHMVSVAGLEQNKISLWYKNLASPISCVYVSYYTLQARILRRITISKYHF